MDRSPKSSLCLFVRAAEADSEGRFCAILFDEMQARELMKTHVVKTTPEASLAEAVDLMDIYQVNSMPVVNSDGVLCGIIAEQDVLQTLFRAPRSSDGELLNNTALDLSHVVPAAATIPVRDVMQHAVVSVAEDACLTDAMRSIIVNNFTRLPVVSAQGEVVGTLNRVDVLQAIFERNLPGLSE
jgi:CBS domain-containing protein